MEANELRIGNWVYTESNTPALMRGSGIGGVENGLLKVHPIPLTPEVLEKCGFVKNMEGIFTHPEYEIIFDKDFECVLDGGEREFAFPCDYLHQLQNIIQVCTGTELDITL